MPTPSNMGVRASTRPSSQSPVLDMRWMPPEQATPGDHNNYKETMTFRPVAASVATLAIAALVFGALGVSPALAAPAPETTASPSTQASTTPAATPLPSNPTVLTPSPVPTEEAVAPVPTSLPTAAPLSSTPAHTTTPAAERPSGGGAVMGEAGQKAPSAVARPFSAQALSEPSVGDQPAGTEGRPLGLDVSGWQQNVNWTSVKKSGARFAYIKTSEGPWTLNDYFAQQYNGASSVGLLRGGYHFARPSLSSGASQARVMLESGGGWSADGKTLPPALDLEDNPYVASDGTNTCYGMTPSALVSWAKDFTNTIKSSTGKDAVIYSSYYFWQNCMGASNAFASSNPLWIAAYYAASPWMPGNWPTYTFWQYANDHADAAQTIPATFPGDQNVFNGTMDQLRTLAGASPVAPAPPPVLGKVPGSTPVSGKWAGDGKSYVGWFKDGFWCLEMPGNQRSCFNFGAAGDKPVTGDWNGDGVATVGIVRGDSWQLTNSLRWLSVDIVQAFGVASDVPITGDWDGDGKTTIGIFRGASWQTTNSQARGPRVDSSTHFGVATDTPLVGDWNGDKRDTYAVRRNDTFWLTDSQQSPTVSKVFAYGIGSDIPATGDWAATGKTSVGIIRGNTWQLSHSLSSLTVDSVRF